MYTSNAESFLVDRNFVFLTPIDITASILGLGILFVLAYIRTNQANKRGDDYYKYYTYAFAFKALFTMFNALFYIIVYHGGGDSIGFWDGAVKLNNLFWKSPSMYFTELFAPHDSANFWRHFDGNTGYPDYRIYDEAPSYFVAKVASVISFFTFKGYILMSLIFAFIASGASWRLYELVRSYGLHKDEHLALGILFIPSLSFWCGGISKDTIVFVCVCYFLHHLNKVMKRDGTGGIKSWIIMLICIYFMLQIRSFMLAVVFAPLIFAWGARYNKRFGPDDGFQKGAIRIFVMILAIVGIMGFMQTSKAQEFLDEAALTHSDLASNNPRYANSPKYDIGVTEYSPGGMLKALPASVLAGFFRPFLWEALSLSLVLNGIESSLLIYFLIKFLFHPKFRERLARIRQHEFLIYGFAFAFILAYFAGFTSVLFGILVRFKAPVLPFLVIVLTAHVKEEVREQQALELTEGQRLALERDKVGI